MRLTPTILSCVVSVWAVNAIAQATFIFQNILPSSIDAPVFDAEGIRLSGTNYAAELWGGVGSDSLSPTFDFSSGQRVVAPFLTDAGAGYFIVTKTMTVSPSVGVFAWVQVRAWDVRLGATYEQVAVLGAGGYGESSLLFIQGGDPNSQLPDSPRYLFGLQSFNLRPIPEPCVWRLSLLGLPAMLWFRRKRR